jgi:hypothetical protein
MERILLIGGIWVASITIFMLCAALKEANEKWAKHKALDALMGACAVMLLLSSCN